MGRERVVKDPSFSGFTPSPIWIVLEWRLGLKIVLYLRKHLAL